MIALTLEKNHNNRGPSDDKNVHCKDIHILRGLVAFSSKPFLGDKAQMFLTYSVMNAVFF